MKRGDVVTFQGRPWLVQVYDPRRLQTALLVASDGATLEVPFNADQLDASFVVLFNPSLDWPFLTVPEKPRWGAIQAVSRIEGRQLLPLAATTEYYLAEPLRCGGSLFLNPSLGLKPGDTLQVQYGTLTRTVNVVVPSSFGTVQQRKAAASTSSVPKGPRTIYDRLLADDGFDE